MVGKEHAHGIAEVVVGIQHVQGVGMQYLHWVVDEMFRYNREYRSGWTAAAAVVDIALMVMVGWWFVELVVVVVVVVVVWQDMFCYYMCTAAIDLLPDEEYHKSFSLQLYLVSKGMFSYYPF